MILIYIIIIYSTATAGNIFDVKTTSVNDANKPD